MKSPTPKRQVAIIHKHDRTNSIWFVAVPDVVETIRQSDACSRLYDSLTGHWEMFVNPLYDFDEVVAWIESMDA